MPFCIKNEIRDYAFTYKKNSDPLTIVKDDYDDIVHVLNKSGTIIDLIYEKDKSGRLHIHGIWQNNGRTPLFARMCPKGYHSHFDQIYDEAGWEKYLYKDYFKNHVV